MFAKYLMVKGLSVPSAYVANILSRRRLQGLHFLRSISTQYNY